MSGRAGSHRPRPTPSADASAAAEPNAFSIGSYLQQQRRLRGISLEDLSLRTRIPLRSLERLEAGAFDGDPDGFVRGFVRTVADGLGLDADATLLRMLREPATAGVLSTGLALSARLWLPLLAVAAAVVLGAAAVRWVARLGTAVPSGPEVVLRRDPVRELAEAQAAALAAAPPESASHVARDEEALIDSADGARRAPPPVPTSVPARRRDDARPRPAPRAESPSPPPPPPPPRAPAAPAAPAPASPAPAVPAPPAPAHP
ncbi:MAG: helix-turn-helix domain-containing protein [Myxococcota bacterium]